MPEASAVRETLRNECGFGGAGGTITYSPAAEPKNHRRDEHQRARNSKRDARAVAAQEDRHEQRREERAEIDDPVEGVEHHLRAVFVPLVELVADERRDARLDAARAERDQRETRVKAGAVILENREARMPERSRPG